MKVVIVTYYWPPAGGSGVQRWLKFVKYFRAFGVEPIVYTVENPKYPINDFSLKKEIPEGVTVLKQPIFEPHTLFSFFKKKSTQQSAGFLDPNPNFIGKIAQYIRANYFIPDARKFWVKPSVSYLKDYIKKNKIDAVITTGPPHSMHLIGLKLKQIIGVKWIADFRDPWTEIDYFQHLPLTKKAIATHKKLEENVVSNADRVLVVGKTMKEKFMKYSKQIQVVTNGYDSTFSENNSVLDAKFTITHVGLMNADRNPISFWKAIKEISQEFDNFEKDLSIQFVGEVAKEVKESISFYNINNIEYFGYKHHEEVGVYQRNSQLLLLTVNNVTSAKGIITGKIFEYLQAKRPILAIGPVNGDLAEIINRTNSGSIVDFDDVAGLKSEIVSLYKTYKTSKLECESKNIEKYHRRNITSQLSTIIKELVSVQ